MKNSRSLFVYLDLKLRVYLHGDASAALQVIAWGDGDGGSDGGRGAGFQAVAGTNELWQRLQSVDTQLNELTLKRERAKRSTCSLRGEKIYQINFLKQFD